MDYNINAECSRGRLLMKDAVGVLVTMFDHFYHDTEAAPLPARWRTVLVSDLVETGYILKHVIDQQRGQPRAIQEHSCANGVSL